MLNDTCNDGAIKELLFVLLHKWNKCIQFHNTSKGMYEFCAYISIIQDILFENYNDELLFSNYAFFLGNWYGSSIFYIYF